MDAFEKELAKKELETLRAINRNINFLGRKLEMTNNILGIYGIAILPGAEETKEQEQPAEPTVKVSDITAWADRFCEAHSIDRQMTSGEVSLVATAFNLLIEDLEKDGKFIQ